MLLSARMAVVMARARPLRVPLRVRLVNHGVLSMLVLVTIPGLRFVRRMLATAGLAPSVLILILLVLALMLMADRISTLAVILRILVVMVSRTIASIALLLWRATAVLMLVS